MSKDLSNRVEVKEKVNIYGKGFQSTIMSMSQWKEMIQQKMQM